MDDDPRVEKYAPGSLSRSLDAQFAFAYTRLLASLHAAFNGDAPALDHAMGLMYELRLLARRVLSTPATLADPADTAVRQTGLCFEYRTSA